MTTAGEIIADAMHLFGIIDQTEDPTPTDIANNVRVLNKLLRAENSDGAAKFLMRTERATLPAASLSSNMPYTFVVGPGGDVPFDAVAIKAIWLNDVSPTLNRETRMAPKADVVRTMFPGIITKWHQEGRDDGSILVTAWQPPRVACSALIEYGGRVPKLTNGDSVVPMPPEGLDDVTLLLGRRICPSYGRSLEAVGSIAADAERVNARWRQWARGQQWVRMVRA